MVPGPAGTRDPGSQRPARPGPLSVTAVLPARLAAQAAARAAGSELETQRHSESDPLRVIAVGARGGAGGPPGLGGRAGLGPAPRGPGLRIASESVTAVPVTAGPATSDPVTGGPVTAIRRVSHVYAVYGDS
jgi:hypothetical protein